MPGIAQFWQTLRPLRKVGKLRGVITVPVFNEACGPAFNCFGVNNTGQAQGTATAAFDLTTAMTIEAWVKLPLLQTTSGVLTIVCNMSKYRVSIINGGKVRFGLTKAATVNNLNSVSTISADEWNHIACVYDGTTMYIYINGVLDSNTLALAAPIDSAASFTFSAPSSLTNATVCVCELRVWSDARTQNEILTSMFSPRDTSGVLDVGLIGYFPFDEGTGASVDNAIAAQAFTLNFTGDYFWTAGDGYPYKLGASYYPLQFAIATDDQYFSLKYPARKPYASVNFVPCIRWTEDGEVKRYRLWDAITGFDAAPIIPEYRGERIPDGCFLEIWNLDGNRTVLLTEAFDLETSILHVVENATTTARTSDATPVANTELAEPFPLTPFPLQFDTQQTF